MIETEKLQQQKTTIFQPAYTAPTILNRANQLDTHYFQSNKDIVSLKE